MAEILAWRLGSWLTAIAVENLAGYFLEGAGGVVANWCKSLHHLISSVEHRAITGDEAPALSPLLPSFCARPKSSVCIAVEWYSLSAVVIMYFGSLP